MVNSILRLATLLKRGKFKQTKMIQKIRICRAAPFVFPLLLTTYFASACSQPAGRNDGFLVSNDPAISDQQVSTIETLGFLVSLAHHADPIHSGDAWTTMTIVDLPGGDMIHVPLAITADSVQDDDVKLSATGTGSGVARANGHSINAKIDLVFQASFHDRHIVSASTIRKATAHVMFRSLTSTNTCSITP